MLTSYYRILRFDNPMGQGVAGSWHVETSAIAKCNGPSAPYCVPNELVASDIGRFLRLPLPPAGILEVPKPPPTAPQRHWFAALNFNLTGQGLPPVNPVRCVAELPELSAGLLLFDVLIGNCDRHARNFAVDFLAQPKPQMNIFDHSHALFGYVAGRGATRLAELRDRLAISGGTVTAANRHCLLDEVNSDQLFQKWIERIQMLPDFLVEDALAQAQPLGLTATEVQAGRDFLLHRRDNFANILRQHRNEFTKIKQWSLI